MMAPPRLVMACLKVVRCLMHGNPILTERGGRWVLVLLLLMLYFYGVGWEDLLKGSVYKWSFSHFFSVGDGGQTKSEISSKHQDFI